MGKVPFSPFYIQGNEHANKIKQELKSIILLTPPRSPASAFWRVDTKSVVMNQSFPLPGPPPRPTHVLLISPRREDLQLNKVYRRYYQTIVCTCARMHMWLNHQSIYMCTSMSDKQFFTRVCASKCMHEVNISSVVILFKYYDARVGGAPH
jgi:hypothetical protein